MGSKTAKKFAIGAAIAGTAGYLVGVLSAPKAGKQTRADIKNAANNGVGELEKQLKELHTELGKMVDDAKGKGGKASDDAQKKAAEAVDSAKVVKDKLRQVLSALHEGEATDKDLDKAVDEAKQALQHLRDYLKK